MNEMRTNWIWNRWFGSAEWLEDIENEYDAIEAAGQLDADSGDATRITPDPAGDDVTADDGRPVDTGYMHSVGFWMGEEGHENCPHTTAQGTPRVHARRHYARG